MDSGELPWWAQARARIALLLLILLAAAGGAVLSAAGRGSASADDGCWLAEGPSAIWLQPSVVSRAAHRLGLTRLLPAGALARQGTSTPEAAWSDGLPRRFARRAPIVPAGYGVSWETARGERLGAAAYRFATPGLAGEFVTRAASARCRPGTAAGTSASPPGARTLVRAGTGGAGEFDLFFSRGATGYWLYATPPRGTLTSASLGASVRQVACRLPEARCR